LVAFARLTPQEAPADKRLDQINRPGAGPLSRRNQKIRGVSMTEDVQFSCTACHIPLDRDQKDTMTACRLCGRLHCTSCVDEFGRCVECQTEEKPEPK
jgi:hypothetical protein